MTGQASKFSTRTPLAHNNLSSVRTQSPVPVPHSTPKFNYRKSDPPLPSNGQTLPSSVTPTVNSTPHNNPLKPVPYTPIDPYSDPISLDSSLSKSSDSSDSGYSKIGWRTHKKRPIKGVLINLLKNIPLKVRKSHI